MKQWIRGPKHILVQLKCITKRSRRSNLGRTGKGEENSCFSPCPMIVKLWSDPFQVCSSDCSFCNLSNYHIDMVHLWWLEGNATFQTIAFIQVVCFFGGALNDDHLVMPYCPYSGNHQHQIFYFYPIMHALSSLSSLLLFPKIFIILDMEASVNKLV